MLRSIVKVAIYPLILYWWVRAENLISDHDFKEADKYLERLRWFYQERSGDLHLYLMLTKFAIGDWRNSISEALTSMIRLDNAKKMKIDNKRYVLIYIKDLMDRERKYEEVNNQHIERLREFDTVFSKLDQKYNSAAIQWDFVSRRYRENFPLKDVDPS